MVGDILQPTHLLFVLVIALVVLGPKRLPEVGRALGAGLRDFRAAINGDHEDHRNPEPQIDLPPQLPWDAETFAEPEPAPLPAPAAVPHASPATLHVPAEEPGLAPAPGAEPAGTSDSGH